MLKPIQSILFATDLSKNCQQALEHTIVQATRFNATIFMLHVIEELPENVGGRLKDLLGRHQWQDMMNSVESNVRQSLLGKQSTNVAVRRAVQKFCQESGIEEDAADYQAREIIISNGIVAEEIVEHAINNSCDLVILGGKKNIFGKISVGTTIKAVIKNSPIPVTIVPQDEFTGA